MRRKITKYSVKLKSCYSSYLSLASIAVGLMACNSPVNYDVTGVVKDRLYEGEWVYLEDIQSEKAIDSVELKEGQFKFEGKLSKPSQVLFRLNNEKYAFAILEQGSLHVDLDEHTAIGTPQNRAIAEFTKQRSALLTELQDSTIAIQNRYDDILEMADHLQTYHKTEYYPKREKLYLDYFKENQNSLAALEALPELADILQPKEFRKQVVAKMSANLKSQKGIYDLINEVKLRESCAEGSRFVDFTIDTPQGPRSLSDYVGQGKYVLVDFWASWCGPCIREMPNLKELYEIYKGDQFEILGVAVMDKLEASLKAIEEQELEWPQILNAQKIPTEIYGIRGIPHLILFGPDGTILKRGARGKELKALIATYLE